MKRGYEVPECLHGNSLGMCRIAYRRTIRLSIPVGIHRSEMSLRLTVAATKGRHFILIPALDVRLSNNSMRDSRIAR
jgi:hypothetical protein